MGLIQWAQNPWGQSVPIHVAWGLLWVSAVGGLLFLLVHATYVAVRSRKGAGHAVALTPSQAAAVAVLPERIARHSLGARLFHWLMAAAMFALLITAFLPKLGVNFPWVTYHWIAGIVLTVAVLYHVVHATFILDFWSIWPDRIDIDDAGRRLRRATGRPAPEPRRFAKYPLENKLYHLTILFAGLAVIGTGLFMMRRVPTPFFTRNPYLFSDMTWGWMYVLHGMAGVALVGLIIVHVYFAIRPEKLFITKAMILGWISRENYIEHHDPQRWPAVAEDDAEGGEARSKEVPV